MKAKKIKSLPIMFLGIADHVETTGQPFPFGTIDLFQLSQHKSHIIYPALTAQNKWIFAVSKELVHPDYFNRLELRVVDEQGKQFAEAKFHSTASEAKKVERRNKTANTTFIPIPIEISSMILNLNFDISIEHPGKYIVEAKWDDKFAVIGDVHFHYEPTPPLTTDQIKAIESDPHSFKALRIELGCKHCSTKLSVYSALERQRKIEDEGSVWQYDICDEFKCECGKTKYSLRYLKESLHGVLIKPNFPDISGYSYVRRYAHSHVLNVVNEFDTMLENEKDEKPFQKYIEGHPILFARFHAKRLFIKPKILGKFEADFAILDTSNQLLLIELERPSMRLFKNDGHPTANLMHAYGQVRDWLHEYAKHPSAVLDGLKLSPDNVVAVKGVVIGGRLISDIFVPLQRHLSKPPYPDINFLTLDDLSRSLIEISRNLV